MNLLKCMGRLFSNFVFITCLSLMILIAGAGECFGQCSPIAETAFGPTSTLIDFDQDPGGQALVDGQLLGNIYGSLGVTFDDNDEATCSLSVGLSVSPPCSTGTNFGVLSNPVNATFAPAARMVGAIGFDFEMKVFDANGQQLAQATHSSDGAPGLSGPEEFGFLGFECAQVIERVEFRRLFQNQTVFGYHIDDLRFASVVCGDGIQEPNEECDDGNIVDGDCCSATCQLEIVGSPCADGNVCNGDEICDGLGVCQPGTVLDCDDGELCTQDSCDATTGCVNLAEPQTGCLSARKAQLQVTDRTDDTRDKVQWKWKQGSTFDQQALGDPAGGTTYALCVYDSTAGQNSLATSLRIDPNPSWRDKDPDGWRYLDKTRSFAGVEKGKLKTGVSGKSVVEIKAKGVNLPTPQPVSALQYFTADPAVTVQLVNTEGVCWNSVFTPTDTKKNKGTVFRAKVKP